MKSVMHAVKLSKCFIILCIIGFTLLLNSFFFIRHLVASAPTVHKLQCDVKSLTYYRHGNLTQTKLTSSLSVAIGLAITTRGVENLNVNNIENRIPFFTSLLPSFCKTCSKGYSYYFYIAHDFNDTFFMSNESYNTFRYVFEGVLVKNRCLCSPNVDVYFVKCGHFVHPAWAQNDAMMAAYNHRRDYYYRINDDTVMETPGWTEVFIHQLKQYDPPNVGVVGPWFPRGNLKILTYDFVHRTHVDIFGFYYPRTFSDWYADSWITYIYASQRCCKVSCIHIVHTTEGGTRYSEHVEDIKQLGREVNRAQRNIGSWMKTKNLQGSVYSGWAEYIEGFFQYASCQSC